MSKQNANETSDKISPIEHQRKEEFLTQQSHNQKEFNHEGHEEKLTKKEVFTE